MLGPLKVLFALAVLVGLSEEARASTCDAHIRFDGKLFRFGFSGTCRPIDVSTIAVWRVGNEERVCQVASTAEDHLPRPLKAWGYGDIPLGFAATTPCQTLEKGQRY